MYYERTETGWKPINKKSVLFSGSTFPVAKVPAEFWTADRMPAAPVPVYDVATEGLSGPQALGDGTVGYVIYILSAEELKLRIPTMITKRQAIEYLLDNDMYDMVMAQLAAFGTRAELIWDAVVEIDRDHELVQALDFTEDQLDVIFTEAAKK